MAAHSDPDSPAGCRAGTRYPNVPCKDYPGCRKGDKCWYSHGPAGGDGDGGAAATTAAPPAAGGRRAGTRYPDVQCKDYPGCRKGDKCWYSHPAGDGGGGGAATPPRHRRAASPRQPGAGTRYPDVVCRDHMGAGCSKGDRCWYSHGPVGGDGGDGDGDGKGGSGGAAAPRQGGTPPPRGSPSRGSPSRRDVTPSLPEDQHLGTRFPGVTCKQHPGCPKGKHCWYSHGMVLSVAPRGTDKHTCFLGFPPHKGFHGTPCTNPTHNGEEYEYCSIECRDKAKTTPKGPLGCRRHNCPCPCTASGGARQFCCEACMRGRPCGRPTHTAPVKQLALVAIPVEGRYTPCARAGCACAAPGGSSWDGKSGHCCRACRNGTPCTQMLHTMPVAEAAKRAVVKPFTGNTCKLQDCTRATWDGKPGYCCRAHRRKGREREGASDESMSPSSKRKSFPDWSALFTAADAWARANGAQATRGDVTNVWYNKSLDHAECPARVSFEQGLRKAGLHPDVDFSDETDGEFGWHGTKSVKNIASISWANWSPAFRSGQAFGPGEYFSRGTTQGLRYSEQYAGGDAAKYLVVAWIVNHKKAAAPSNPDQNGAGAKGTGHIVCNNPVSSAYKPGEKPGPLYCVPCAVTSFAGSSEPPFLTKPPSPDELCKAEGCAIC